MVVIDPNKGIFPISVVGEILDINPRKLRVYEEHGVITPSRSDKNRRLYSLKDIELLEYVHYLTRIKKMTLAGVKVVLNILEQISPDEKVNILKEADEYIESLSKKEKEIFKESEAPTGEEEKIFIEGIKMDST